jgi:hypothetical protein
VKRYLLKVGVVAVCLIVAQYFVLLTIRAPLPAEYWIREFVIAKRYDAAQMQSPKIIFVGGSCTLFGIDAAQVQKSMGMPAVNFGLHAGMRLEDHLAEALAAAKPTDIVVLSLEPAYYDYYSATWTTWQLRSALAWRPEDLNALTPWERWRVLVTSSDFSISTDLLESDWMKHFSRGSLSRRYQALGPEETILERYRAERGTSRTFAYDLSNLDANGDLLNATADNSFHGDTWPVTQPSHISAYAKSRLVPFLEEMKRRGVRVLFDYTPYLIYESPNDDWKQAEAQFRGEIAALGGKLIERRDAFFYPNALFFNSNLHLCAKGREMRTQTLIGALRAEIKPGDN